MSASDDAPDQFSAHVAANDLTAAETVLPKLRQASAEHHLMLYLLAMKQGRRKYLLYSAPFATTLCAALKGRSAAS